MNLKTKPDIARLNTTKSIRLKNNRALAVRKVAAKEKRWVCQFWVKGSATDLLYASTDPTKVVHIGVAGRSFGQQVLKVALILGQPLYLQQEKRQSAIALKSHEHTEKGGSARHIVYVIEIQAE